MQVWPNKMENTYLFLKHGLGLHMDWNQLIETQDQF